jgi:hypothetical protein
MQHALRRAQTLLLEAPEGGDEKAYHDAIEVRS